MVDLPSHSLVAADVGNEAVGYSGVVVQSHIVIDIVNTVVVVGNAVFAAEAGAEPVAQVLIVAAVAPSFFGSRPVAPILDTSRSSPRFLSE